MLLQVYQKSVLCRNNIQIWSESSCQEKAQHNRNATPIERKESESFLGLMDYPGNSHLELQMCANHLESLCHQNANGQRTVHSYVYTPEPKLSSKRT